MILSGKFKVMKPCTMKTEPFSSMFFGDEFRMDIPAIGEYLCSGKSSAVSVQITYKDEQYIITGGKVYTALHSMRISQIPFIN